VAGQLSSGVVTIYSNEEAFVAVKADGSLVKWGWNGSGGGPDQGLGTTTSRIYSNGESFVAVDHEGGLYSWGNQSYGGGGYDHTGKSICSP
jgi:alpha-tubulin suppressor-like RCC1 family protein